MTLDLNKNKNPYFSSFKSISRDRKEYVDNVNNIKSFI